MKKFVFTTIALLITLCCHAELKQAVTLYLNSGTKIVYFLDTAPVISFAGQTMVITADSDCREIPFQDIDYWQIGMAEFGSIMSEWTDVESISIYGNQVRVSNPDAQLINVYDLSGRLVYTSFESEATFRLSSAIYVITIANKSFKIAVR